jgi:hypothetical protein
VPGEFSVIDLSFNRLTYLGDDTFTAPPGTDDDASSMQMCVCGSH